MKTITLKIAGTDSKPLAIVIHPGVTAEVLLDTPDQEEDILPRDDAFDPEDEEPDWLFGGFNPS